MMTSSSYSKMRSFFTTDIIRRYTYIVERSVSKGELFYIKLQTHLQSLRERIPLLFAISDIHSGR